MNKKAAVTTLCLAGVLLLAGGSAGAHGTKTHTLEHAGNTVTAPPEQMPWGIAGSPEKVNRTIELSMLDEMRFIPALVEVAYGETIRFRVQNDGKTMHEFVLGTQDSNDKHAALMVKFPGMEHDSPYMAHVAPGQTGEIIWTFNEPGSFQFACLIAGHYQAGMIGTLTVSQR